jgi:hypothetical protein
MPIRRTKDGLITGSNNPSGLELLTNGRAIDVNQLARRDKTSTSPSRILQTDQAQAQYAPATEYPRPDLPACSPSNAAAYADQHPACLPPSPLARPPHKPHRWLTNRINIPTAINRASRVPTANERARFRRSSGFDPAPFCAAPISNQNRSLSIAIQRRQRWTGKTPRELRTAGAY